MAFNRKLSAQEERLIELLISKSSLQLNDNWKDDLLVKSMDDGGMGSLFLFPEGLAMPTRLFGKQVSECQFVDEDGVDVIVSLNVDKEGKLLELDIWKADFSSLIRIPDNSQIR